MNDRTIVGYDLRRGSCVNRLFMTSYDDEVRYEDINEKYQAQQSGMNLFPTDPSGISILKIPEGARIVAIDLPTKYVRELLKGNVSNPSPIPTNNLGPEWSFAGFDIVDPITQTSALYGIDLSVSLDQILTRNSQRLNGHGLIEDGDAAGALASLFDQMVPEHAPFMPAGVWLKH